MSSSGPFVRNPREIPFLREQVEQVLALAVRCSRRIVIQHDDDFGFMTVQFLSKQKHHVESILSLVPRRDACLIARTMLEGLYQLLLASNLPAERGRRWRSFSVIHDWRLNQGRLREGLPIDQEHARTIDAALLELGELHRRANAPADADDPYHKSWRGGVSLSSMASTVGREMYDIPYVEFSDWEHWGVSGIGDSMTVNDNQIEFVPNSDRIEGLSLLAAFQSLLQTLEVANLHFSLNCTEAIKELTESFVVTMNGLRSNTSV